MEWGVKGVKTEDFDPFEVIFSGFQRQAPLKPENRGKPRPEMDSAPSK